MKKKTVAALILVIVGAACEKRVKSPDAKTVEAPATAASQGTDARQDYERGLAMRRSLSPREPLSDADRKLLNDFRALHPESPPAPDGFKATVNRYCPVMPKNPLRQFTALEHTVEFEGQTIGFCCDDCPDAWKVMSDDERRAAVKTVLNMK